MQLCCKNRTFATNTIVMLKKIGFLFSSGRLQSAGMVLTVLCAVHCMALPVFFILGSVMAVSVLSNPWVELGLLPVAFVIAGFILYRDYRHHARKLPLHLFMIGACLGIIGLVFHFHLFIGTSALLVVAAQYLNFRFHKVYCTH